ncbi:glycosyltransferase family A protein [Actibacterium sp.]|uniref:glycosyltransferase family A protein n=1 Tax=Actibacterium sp. TaxID=1872125 RepID=UPI0035647FD3
MSGSYPLEVAIFSYNRGAYLKQAVASVQRNIPQARLRVFDDDSDDPETCAYLDQISDMVTRHSRRDTGDRHGGLYINMQRALESAQAPRLLMLQDDTQVVRPVDATDLAQFDALFAADPKAGFICPLFIRGQRKRRYRRRMMPDPDLRCYRARPGKPGLGYFDITVLDVERLRQADWRFQLSEDANIAQARQLFSEMPLMADPFAFYCPEVPFYRHRRQSLAAQLAPRIIGTGVKGYHDLTADQVAALRARPLKRWPVAEKFLTPTDPATRRPFVYKDVKARWYLNLMYKVEQALRLAAITESNRDHASREKQ